MLICRRAGRGFERGDLALGHRVGIALETDECGDRRSAVAPAALAVAPEHAFGVARGDEADSAAEAAAFVPFVHGMMISA